MNPTVPAEDKLKTYLTSGKTYFEATQLLQNEGYTQAQIIDAKMKLDALGALSKPEDSKAESSQPHISIANNPELAADLLKVSVRKP
jgi:hypothetical protein